VLTRPHELPSGGGKVAVQWRKRRWPCRMQACEWTTFTEQVARVPAGMRTTTRLRAAVAVAVAVADGRDQSEVAAAQGVSWPTVARAVVVYGAVELVGAGAGSPHGFSSLLLVGEARSCAQESGHEDVAAGEQSRRQALSWW
jgi:hypothetical protein